MEWNAVINNFTLPLDAPYSISIICWSTISLPQHANANGSGKRFCQLNCMVNTNCQNKTFTTEVAILVALMLNRGPFWPGSSNGYRPASPMSRPWLGPKNWQTNKACSHCRSHNWLKIPLFRSIPLFWMVLCSSMLLFPFFWIIKFRGVLHERKGDLMILHSNADENGALTFKGGAFVWKEWARLQFQCRGVINLDFLIDREGSMAWCRRKKKLL